jgi:hypothetical protein
MASCKLLDAHFSKRWSSLQVAAGKKKGQKSAVTKKKSTKNKNSAQRKAGNKSGQPYAGNDLTAKLFATMEKHKEVYY